VNDDPIFTPPPRPPRFTPITFREAIMGSVLAHAFLVIAVLLLPAGFLRAPVFLTPAQDRPVHMTFVQDSPRPGEANPLSPNISDRDRRRAQEMTPPRPARTAPYSRGNTPAQVAEGPLKKTGPPPGAPPPMVAETPREVTARNPMDSPNGKGALYVPPRGAEESGQAADASPDALAEKGARLRDALAQMGAQGAGSGGSNYRFDNPTGGLATPSGSLSFDTKGFDWGPYSRRIYWIIWSNWHDRMPPAVYAGLKGSVTVHFVIHKDGRITDIEILSPSGVPAYDSAATLALEASSPLPPLPDNFPKESDGVTGRFLYNIWEDGD